MKWHKIVKGFGWRLSKWNFCTRASDTTGTLIHTSVDNDSISVSRITDGNEPEIKKVGNTYKPSNIIEEKKNNNQQVLKKDNKETDSTKSAQEKGNEGAGNTNKYNAELKSSDGTSKEEYISPVKEGNITSNYGIRVNPVTKKPNTFHAGIDIDVLEGTPVYAVKDGIVEYKAQRNENGELIGYGYYINLKFSDDTGYAKYAHLSNFQQTIESEQSVKKGDIIGYSGNTGTGTGPHLHFQLHLYGDKDRITVNSP